MIDNLRLVVSELVSNADLYAKTTIDVVLSIGEGPSSSPSATTTRTRRDPARSAPTTPPPAVAA